MDPADLVKQAQAKTNRGGLFGFLKEKKYDEAAELYQQAGNLYKLKHDWENGAYCFGQAAEMFSLYEDPTAQASNLLDAGHCLRHLSLERARPIYGTACDVYIKNGRFSQAARTMKTLAEEFEKEGSNPAAAEFYKKAADYFALDEYGKSAHSQCILKYANLAALKGDLDEAIKIFETEGRKSLNNALTASISQQHFLNAGILHLAKGDALSAILACEEYEKLVPRFKEGRHGQFLRQLCESYEKNDPQAFTDVVTEYDTIMMLNQWSTHFLAEIKRALCRAANVPLNIQIPHGADDDLPRPMADDSGEFDLT